MPDAAAVRYQADGFYLVQQPILRAELIERASAGMDAVRRGESDTGREPLGGYWNPGDDPGKLGKMELPQLTNRAIRELVSSPVLGEWAARVTGARGVQVWWTQLLYKPPATGSPEQATSIGWHQDRNYWGCWEPGSELFTAWVALTDVASDCGPMRFVAGSHHWGLLVGSDFYGQDLEAVKAAMGLPAGAAWSEVAAILPPGGFSFHDNLTVHGSSPNHSGRPRRSFAIHMRTEKSRPVEGKREGLTTYLDDLEVNPVIYGTMG
ncbi:MAG: phytanoyl-CoA dioxygenase family protein [Armatimonadetes bacterium]|nr:phytanoyl-CoA dioxygenase family protein [Armatimonadota bacterium]